MGIAFTQADIVTGTIRGDSSANLPADIAATLVAAGWSRVRSVTNGYVYQTESPQSIGVRVLVQDQGNAYLGKSYIRIQFMNLAEDAPGYAHQLIFGAGREFLMTAGICQFFIAPAGICTEAYLGASGHTVAGGIPFIPENLFGECGAEAPDFGVTGNWWSCGSGLDGVSRNFRNGYVCAGAWSGSLNSLVAMTLGGGDYRRFSCLRLFPLTSTEDVDSSWYTPMFVRRLDDSPLLIDPLIGWENPYMLYAPARVFGQIWDALLVTEPRDLESEFTTEEEGNTVTWSCWSDGPEQWGDFTHFCSLHLIKGIAGPPGGGLRNYAY